MNCVWKQRIEPFRIWGNLFFCGSVASSCHIIDTEDGLIMIDPGLPETFYQVIESMWELGFKPSEVKYILHTHGHYDHAGATRAMLGLVPNAKTYISEDDADIVRGKNKLSLSEAFDTVFDGFFEPDVCLCDGDTVKLGNTEIFCVSTPGHTQGTMTFFFDAVKENGNKKRCGMQGGIGVNSMMLDYYAQYGLDPAQREQFVPGLERVRNEHVDICLGSHTYCNNTQSKGKRVLAGETDAFVNEEEWAQFCDKAIKSFEAMVARGQ